MPNRNTLKPLKYPLAANIIARNKRFLLTEFYQGIRMQSRRADVFSRACLDTDSLQKRMSLQALVPASNESRNGLKLILLFCNYDMLLYLAAALIRLCHQSYKAFSYLNIRIIQSILPIMPVIAFNCQVPALIKHRQRIFCIRSVINKIL